ncbi:MAG: hypothetical protein HZB17_05045 [Chloroflexi bacterium]|nr:hypothetical protein [Chloroflexota bacterium]MBI5080658.1 hypothetical protein [Chloroflexota bacterium]MBI5347789.1 hypothetical protein [Chloroflexota bacterium]
MANFVEFPLEGGGTILIEVVGDTKSQTGFTRAGVADSVKDVAEKATQTFDSAMENIRKSSNLLVSKLRGLSEPPDEMEVVFSLKASGELGNIAVGKGGAEANYSVRLKWKKEEKPPAPPTPKKKKTKTKNK